MFFKVVVSGLFYYVIMVGCKVCCSFRLVPHVSRGIGVCYPQFVVVFMLGIRMGVGGVLRVHVALRFPVPLMVPVSPFYCAPCRNGMAYGGCRGKARRGGARVC